MIPNELYKKLRWYPSAKTQNHYVFLNTLENDNPSLFSAAKEMLKVNGKIEDFNEEIHFEQALSFLKLAADSEQKKEEQFLLSKGIDIPFSGETKYLEYIKLLNEALIGLEEFKDRVYIEKNRKGWSYTQGAGSYINSALNQLKKDSPSEEEIEDSETIAKIVRSILINSINKSIFSKELNLNELAVVIGSVQSQIMSQIKKAIGKNGILGKATDEIKEDYYYKNGKININKIKKLIQDTNEYKNYFGSQSKKQINELKKIANNFNSKYYKTFTPEARKLLEQHFKKEELAQTKSGEIDWDKVIERKKITNFLNEKMKFEDIYHFDYSKNTGMGGEARIYQDLSNTIVSWCGSSGGKADVLSFDIGNINITKKAQKEKLYSAFNKINKNIGQKMQKEYEKANQKISQEYANLEKILDKINLDSNGFKQSFLIHSSVKDYSTSNSKDFKGFEGGTWSGLSIVDSLDALQNVGFSSFDVNWLKSCLINTSSESIGSSNKEGLEKYFSLFASMLLFDDGVSIAKNAIENSQKSSLKVLHLFPLNGIYVPSSYIMRETYNSLKNFDFSSGAYAKINTGNLNFKEELQKITTEDNFIFGEKRWQTIRDKQISAMSVRIRFLKNFNDLINSFYF